MKIEHTVGMIVGLPAFVFFCYYAGTPAGVALFFVLFGNNLSQVKNGKE